MPFTAGEMIEWLRQGSRAAMLLMCTSSTGNGIALMASCNGTPCCVSPAGLTSAPCTVSMFSCSLSISAPSWFDWKHSSDTPSSRASDCSFASIWASVVVP